MCQVVKPGSTAAHTDPQAQAKGHGSAVLSACMGAKLRFAIATATLGMHQPQAWMSFLQNSWLTEVWLLPEGSAPKPPIPLAVGSLCVSSRRGWGGCPPW